MARHLSFRMAVALGLLAGTGCYTVVLEPIQRVSVDPIPVHARVYIPPESAGYTYTVRSFAAGVGNTFTIRVGVALSQYADAYLAEALQDGDDALVQIDIEGFTVKDFEAHIDARFRVNRGNATLFDKVYHANGVGHFAQTVWLGAFAMKSSMRKTTDEALRSLFEQFLSDVRHEGSLR